MRAWAIDDGRVAEAVVLPDSPFVGRAVSRLGLNRLYGVKVMAIQRHGRQHRYHLRGMRLLPESMALPYHLARSIAGSHDLEMLIVQQPPDLTGIPRKIGPDQYKAG